MHVTPPLGRHGLGQPVTQALDDPEPTQLDVVADVLAAEQLGGPRLERGDARVVLLPRHRTLRSAAGQTFRNATGPRCPAATRAPTACRIQRSACFGQGRASGSGDAAERHHPVRGEATVGRLAGQHLELLGRGPANRDASSEVVNKSSLAYKTREVN